MAGADDIIATLLAGTGFGRTPGDVTTQNLQNQGLAQQNQLGALQLLGAQRQQQQDAHDQQAFQAFQDDYGAHPTPGKLLDAMVRFPKQYQALKAVHDAKDTAAQTADLGYWSGVHSAVNAGKYDIAASAFENRIRAEKAAGTDTSVDEQYLAGLRSKDPDTIKAVTADALANIAVATGPDKFASTYGAITKGSEGYTLTPGAKRFDANNTMVASAPAAEANALEVPVYDADGHRIGTKLIGNGGKGGDPASGGTAAGGTGDVSRLVNSDAGGGYVPDSVKTLGQFVTYGKALNGRGAKSSSAGTYQINGSTMAEFGPKALGPDWKNAPFNADTQERVGEAIFNWAKQQPNPAQALRGRWVSLDPKTAANLVQGDWSQARNVIAQGETGGGAGASASRGDPSYIGPVGGSAAAAEIKPGDISTVPSQMRAAVQAIADGRSAPPRPGTRNGEAMLDAVTAYDPTFDAANATSRVKTRVDFTSGKSAQSVNALNTAMGHLLHLDDQAHDLPNASFMPGILNPGQEWFQTNVVGSSAYKTFNQTKQAAASEMRKVFAGSSGGNLAELEEWQRSLSATGSYSQLHDVIRNGVDLMSSRLNALQDQYATGMGRSDKTPQLIKPSVARAVRQRFGVDIGGGAAQPQGQSAPVRVTTPAQAAALPSGTLFVTPDGRTLRKR